MTTSTKRIASEKSTFPLHGCLGLSLILVFWGLNWVLTGLRTHWAFFPLWRGYCLAIDGLVFRPSGTSFWKHSKVSYLGLFLVSALVWWIFELLNTRPQNWTYPGIVLFSPLEYSFWTTLSFTTVIPAVIGSAEFFASFDFLKRLRPGPRVGTIRSRST